MLKTACGGSMEHADCSGTPGPTRFGAPRLQKAHIFTDTDRNPVSVNEPRLESSFAETNNSCVAHLRPNGKPNFDTFESDTDFHSPKPSLAKRQVSGASTAHFTGQMVIPDGLAGRVLLSESRLEILWAIYLLSLPEVDTIVEQVPFDWVDEVGVEHTKFFDLVLILKNGRQIACEVKPVVRLQSGRVLRELRLIAHQAQERFHDVRLLTDKDLDRDAMFNAEMIFGMRHPDAEADAAATGTVESLRGAATMADLVEAIGLGARGMRALVRLIGAREIRLCDPGRIGPLSLVRRTEVR